jgi:protein-S-isoprenylcysteine O-methyltransferase Ste14
MPRWARASSGLPDDIGDWRCTQFCAGLVLEFAALVRVRPRNLLLLAAVLGCAWVFVQARLEERNLLRRMPAYREYMNRVPGFLPRLASKVGV